LISSNGGDVFAGVTGYNYLKGIRALVETHNFGYADSIAADLFCAGTIRSSVLSLTDLYIIFFVIPVKTGIQWLWFWIPASAGMTHKIKVFTGQDTSVPNAKFSLHGAAVTFPQGVSYEEQQLEEQLNMLKAKIAITAKLLPIVLKEVKKK
jgi:hypothetical protein